MGLLNDIDAFSIGRFLAEYECFLDNCAERNNNLHLVNSINKTVAILKKSREEKYRKEFIELVRKIAQSEYVTIFVLANEHGTYDIFMAVEQVKGMTQDLSYSTVVALLSDYQVFSYVLEDVDRENAEKFLKAFYIYKSYDQQEAVATQSKNLIYNDVKYSFRTIKDGRISPLPPNKKTVFYEQEIAAYDFNRLSLPASKPRSFEEALDEIYENKYFGTKMRLLK